MGLYYQERHTLAEALRRHVHEASTHEYDVDFKNYLLILIDKFEKQGYGALIDADEQNDFKELFEHATY